MKLKTKLFKVQTALLRGFNKDQTGHYQYTSLTNINQSLKPLLIEFKVRLEFSFDEIETITINNQPAFKLLLKTVFYDVESEEEQIIKTYYIKSIKPNLDLIQNLGGAQTYARRYFLISFFNLISDDDVKFDPDAVGIETAFDKKGKATATEIEQFIADLNKLPIKTQHAFKHYLSKDKLYKIKKLSLKLYDLKFLKETLAKAKLANTPKDDVGVTSTHVRKKRVAKTAGDQKESIPPYDSSMTNKTIPPVVKENEPTVPVEDNEDELMNL